MCIQSFPFPLLISLIGLLVLSFLYILLSTISSFSCLFLPRLSSFYLPHTSFACAVLLRTPIHALGEFHSAPFCCTSLPCSLPFMHSHSHTPPHSLPSRSCKHSFRLHFPFPYISLPFAPFPCVTPLTQYSPLTYLHAARKCSSSHTNPLPHALAFPRALPSRTLPS